MHSSLRLVIASLLVLSAACDTAGVETPTVSLGSELDVGHGLLKGCSSILAEAGALCSGRKPFRLYAEPSSACKAYFWCAPGRGACLLSCPQGKVFNAATSSCQEASSSASLAFDHTTCTSSSSSSAPTTQHRRLASADTSSAQPPADTHTIQQPTNTAAAAAAIASSSGDDSTVIFHAASRIATDSSGRQVPLPPAGVIRRPGPPAFGTWTPQGKQYSSGPFAGSGAVKEPAVGGPRQPGTTPLPPSSTSSSGRGPSVTNEIGSRSSRSSTPAAVAVSAPNKPPVYAEDDSAAPAGARSLLGTQHSTAQHTAARQLSMKRLPPGSTTTSSGSVPAATAQVAVAGSSANLARPQHTRPAAAAAAATPAAAAAAAAGTPPSAAKSLGPDDVDAPVAVASTDAANAADAADRHHHPLAHNPARLIRGAARGVFASSSSSRATHPSSSSSVAMTPPSSSATIHSADGADSTDGSSSNGGSSSGEAIPDVGQLTGPEAEAIKREFAAAPPVHVNPTTVPLPEYLQGADSLEGLHFKGKHSTHGSRGHQGHSHGHSSYGTHGSYGSHGHKKASHRGHSSHYGEDKEHEGSSKVYKTKRGAYHSSSGYEQQRPRKSYSRYAEEADGADSLQQ